jgi:hypothetical protein
LTKMRRKKKKKGRTMQIYVDNEWPFAKGRDIPCKI